jgi:catechol 2,3-dioxygenase-like lactoylglutathione lyase family enzyme
MADEARPNKVATVIIPVADQDKAVQFYCDALGFDKRVDVPFQGGQYRWIEVGLPGESTTIALAPPPQDGSAEGGRETGISLQTDDIDAYHARLAEAGVDVGEVQRMGDPVPPMFWFHDCEGNSLMVVQ